MLVTWSCVSSAFGIYPSMGEQRIIEAVFSVNLIHFPQGDQMLWGGRVAECVL